MKMRVLAVLTCMVLMTGATLAQMGGTKSEKAKSAPKGVLKAADIGPKLFPESVFFGGQTAPVQMRNTGGVRLDDGKLVLAGMVDTSGYSSGVKEKYQAYLINEVSLTIGGQELKPGAYGCGVAGGKFMVMDIANQDVLQADSKKDSELKRPTPLQVTREGDGYRLYFGRDYVEFTMGK